MFVTQPESDENVERKFEEEELEQPNVEPSGFAFPKRDRLKTKRVITVSDAELEKKGV
jgi:hypothetical protein